MPAGPGTCKYQYKEELHVDLTIVLYEQTEIILGNRKNYSDAYFDKSPEENEKNAIAFIRLMVKTFLHCRSLEAAKKTVLMEDLENLELKRVIQYVRVPKFVEANEKDEYLTAKIFTPGFDSEEWVAEKLCKRIENNTLKIFPKYYIAEEAGRLRAAYCLRYFVARELSYMTIP